MTTILRILMVEDSEDDAILILETLNHGGLDVRHMRVETEAGLREALRDGKWDIVLSDYCLPSFNAEGTLRVLREMDCDIPAIVVSGTVGEDVAVETIKHGADDYLLKQNLIRLVPAINQALNAAEIRRQRHRLERMKTIILDSSPDLICLFDQQGHFLEVSSAAKNILGYEPGELEGLHFDKLAHLDDLARIKDEFQAVLQGRNSKNFETCCVHKSGSVVHMLWAAAFSRADGVVVGIGHDITERKQMEERLREKTALFDAQVESSPDGIIVVDTQGNLVIENQRMRELWKIPPRVAVEPGSESLLDFVAQRTTSPTKFIAKAIWLDEHPEEIEHDELELIDGTILDRYSAPVLDKEGHYYGRIWIHRDITKRRQAEQHIRYLAMYDDLTGLPNRNMIEEEIVQAIARAGRTNSLGALLYVDMDRFKGVNDGYGHLFGDMVLKAIGKRLCGLVREGDPVARLGGDEFLILLADLRQATDADIVARKIVASLDSPIVVEGREIYLPVSVGVSMFPRDGEDVGHLIDSADMAMYRAKELGRNTYQFFTREMSEETQRRVDIENKLRNAAAAGQFQLVYQPKVDLESGSIIGCEALLRWHHPELGTVSPADFIPIAEDSGLIVSIGDWVLHAACEQARCWMDSGMPPVRVAVNISVLQFLQQDMVAWVKRTLEETGLPPEWLELELTESAIAQDIEKVIHMIDQLQAIGVKLSVDDFGTGYSSLSYLRQFHVDTLKIDQSFVRNMLTKTEDATIVLAVIALAHNLNFKVIAEGVETEQHYHFLRLNHCDEIQGYYFSRPVPPWEFEAMIREDKQLA
ncbi:EAL domain-containing protein [Methylobacillus sp.]|uniref:EAL domain-containing protein n=1 Tax=Methylobacillus sp. TaxID=56818 RepID=UPI002FE2BDD2